MQAISAPLNSMPHKKFYTLTYISAAAFILSLSLNFIGLLMMLRGGNLKFGVENHHIQPRTIPVEVVDSDSYGMSNDHGWASLTPRGHGFVKIDGDFYALSLYHQLHCLNSFRRAFNKSTNGSHSDHVALHAEHCLSYMRQMVLCAGDTTLEPAFSAMTRDGSPTRVVYGVGVTHQCRDWVQIRHFAEDNYELWKDEGREFAATEVISDSS